MLFELDTEIEASPESSACVMVSNQGCLGVGPGVRISFYEEELGLVGTVERKGPITLGGSESVCFATETLDEPLDRVRLGETPAAHENVTACVKPVRAGAYLNASVCDGLYADYLGMERLRLTSPDS